MDKERVRDEAFSSLQELWADLEQAEKENKQQVRELRKEMKKMSGSIWTLFAAIESKQEMLTLSS